MKKSSFILVLFLSITHIVSCQKPQASTHITIDKLDKFQGAWRGIIGYDTVKIQIVKYAFRYSEPQNSSIDRLLGTHYFSENGKVIQSSMNRFDSIVAGHQDRYTLILWRNVDMDTSKVEGLFHDLVKNKRGALAITYIGGTPAQMVWTLKNEPGPKAVLPGETFDPYFRMPLTITFTKQ